MDYHRQVDARLMGDLCGGDSETDVEEMKLSKSRSTQAHWIVQSCGRPIITSSRIQHDVGIVDEAFRTYDFGEVNDKASQ